MLQCTSTVVLPGFRSVTVGASGTVAGVALPDTVDTSPTPAPDTAAMRNQYVVPFERPVNVWLHDDAVVVQPATVLSVCGLVGPLASVVPAASVYA